jgi:hypothetical protein
MTQRQIIDFSTEAAWLANREQDITSTEAASLFGYGRETPFELATRKAGKIKSAFEPNERTEIGKDIEAAIAIRAARLFGVVHRPKREYIRLPEYRIGASFDFEINAIADCAVDDNRLRLAFGSLGPGLMEIKNVDYFVFRDQWNAGEEPEAPPHIEIQLQQQLECSGYAWGVIVVFVGGNRIEIIMRQRDETFGAVLRKRIAAFWFELNAGRYPPVSLPEDLGVIKQLYGYAEPGRLLDARGDIAIANLLTEYIAASKDQKAAKDRMDTAHGQLLQLIGDAEKVQSDVASISCSIIPACHIAFDRKPYRNWKVTAKKGAKKEAKEESEE